MAAGRGPSLPLPDQPERRMKVTAQAYFTTSMFKFLQELKANSGRAWFAEHMRRDQNDLCDAPEAPV